MILKKLYISIALTFGVLISSSSSVASDSCAQLVMFEAEYCEWCERWHEEIGDAYPMTSEGRAAPLRPVNIHEDLPDDLKNIKAVVFTPTFVLVQDGREIGRLPGYVGENFFWALLEEMFIKAGLGKPDAYCAP